MDTKPIRRTSQLLLVSREHHFGLLFCWKIRQGIKRSIAVERMLNYLRFFFNGHLITIGEKLHDHDRHAFIDVYPDEFWLNQSASL
ncbi:MAG: hypothetical protein QM763_04385 [Agriterribacter sp.]